MALDPESIRSLISQLEQDRQAYLNSHNKLHQALQSILPNQAENSPTNIDAILAQGNSPEPLSNHRPASLSGRSRVQTQYSDTQVKQQVTSLYSVEDSSDSDADESFFVQRPLEEREYDEADLKRHLRYHKWNDHGRLILGKFRQQIKLQDRPLFPPSAPSLKDDTGHNGADIYEVDEHGAPLKNLVGETEEGDRPAWEALRQTNKLSGRKQSVGRIIVIREPSPLLFGALHLTMNEHFDMDFICKVLVDDETSTKAFVKGHIFPDERHQRSLLFVFKYHTLVGKDRKPLPWQHHDQDIESKPDHIPISTCSAVVGLSLSGKPIRAIRRHSRRSKTSETSQIYDPFAPYHVLSVQLFPDWHSEVNLHETHHHYVNGPDAFLLTLQHEYRDAIKRLKELTKRIAELVTPDKKNIFLAKMRDELLFENEQFVYSRRYFWASQTLGLVIDEIEAMIASYKDTFTDDVWTGDHKTLFPGPASTSARYTNWRKKMNSSRKLLEREIETLKEMLRTCYREQKDIEKLREWLFAGTSVQESRKAVEQAAITVNQGYNIKLLTLVTIFFLPLTFVTSVFGMTNMDPNEGFVHFGIVTAAVCLPTYFLIGIINEPDQFEKTVAVLGYPFVWLRSGFKHSSARAKTYRDKYIHQKEEEPKQLMTRAQTLADLDERSSREIERYAISGVTTTIAAKSDTDINERPPLVQEQGVSTIRFDIPKLDAPAKVHVAQEVEPSPGSSMPALEKTMQVQTGTEILSIPQRQEQSSRHSRSHSSPASALLRRLSRDKAGVKGEKSPV